MKIKNIENNLFKVLCEIWQDDLDTFHEVSLNDKMYEVVIFNKNYNEVLLHIPTEQIEDIFKFFYMVTIVVVRQRGLGYTLEIESYEELERWANE